MQHDADALLEALRPLVSARDYNVIVKRFGLDGQQALSWQKLPRSIQSPVPVFTRSRRSRRNFSPH